jgi:hypothetical protein
MLASASKPQLLLETAGLALPYQLLGYDPAAISHSDAADTLANDVALCGETRSAVVVAWAPTSSWQINKREPIELADQRSTYTKAIYVNRRIVEENQTSRSWLHAICSPMELLR